MRTTVLAWLFVAILVLFGLWWFFTPKASVGTQPSQTTANTSQKNQIPGENLTLGQSSGAVGKYVIGYNGMTLYTYAPDTAGVSNCTGGCAAAWPPYTVTSTANLVAESPLSGKIGTLTRNDGSMQVTYNGHPLYFFGGDSAPGDTNGEGLDGVWYVAQP